ncbi:hypothetical protein [Synechococcus sp. MU1611]|uniref:tetratricopeptide repeat protein n=1 Tax=Synechococcus sp. MU1611 TaxID=2508345 RepID=UPI001CF8878F|nr:hypothetical protein [Synechococcus sp. MU1611]MCB4411502.1 hypothetical protein [Synechococcus sp. MU1611]
MGLPRALQAHKKGDLQQAEAEYLRAIDQNVKNPIIHQNYGAILRNRGELNKAKSIYDEGLSLFPSHRPLLQNACNLYAEMDDHVNAFHTAYRLITLLFKKTRADKDSINRKILDDLYALMMRSLKSLGCYNLALSIAHSSIKTIGIYPQTSLELYSLLSTIKDSSAFDIPRNLEQQLLETIEKFAIEDFEIKGRSNYYLVLAQLHLSKDNLTAALASYENAMSSLRNLPNPVDNTKVNIKSLQQNFDVGSWNLGCSLLNFGDFEHGWKLFEYGLRSPAPGPQRWQRAVKKPFTDKELPLWRGQFSDSYKLLLIEEQAIGDVMMFLTLLPRLIGRFKSIAILLNDRLIPIYRRSLASLGSPYNSIKIWSFKEFRASLIDPSQYDFQSPVGSVCQYLNFPSESSQSIPLNHEKQLKLCYSSTRESLRDKYLSFNGHNVERLVGISWRGGGRGKRIQQKSMDRDLFNRLLLPIPGVRYVSLQYGEELNDVTYWQQKGVDVLCDSSINPMKNMDLWLDQVGSCDAVITVANTTVHGSGGLGIPTMCLLSQFYDWRWLASKTNSNSYWYNSVGIARQEKNSSDSKKSWDKAITLVNNWTKQGFPNPISFFSN